MANRPQDPAAFSFISSSGFGINSLGQILRRGDLAFAIGIIAILTVLILPLPKWLLDVSLAMSLALSILVLLTALFIKRPLEFSSFPTLLLVSTMMGLSLNVASTRLILGNGHEGPGAAGDVIRAFGNFIMGGNFVIGIIVFAILVLVNFVVITKGSGRIAEVSARFSLDAMPGKQMAIDAELSAGMINEAQAKERRKTLESESNFFGAMDGAAKFVRGDAIAGLCITLINIIGGIIIGVVQNNLNFMDAMHTYTLLTVGDGLITQIPALIVSTAAGILVSKAGVEGSADKALFQQLSAYPSALGLSSFLMAIFSLLPGIPMIPFILLSGLTGTAALKMTERRDFDQKTLDHEATQDDKPAEIETDPLKAALNVDQIKLELGYGILSIVNGDQGIKLTDQIKSLRQQMARENGFILPTVRIQDNLELTSERYIIKIKEIAVGAGELRAHMLMCIDPAGNSINLIGESTIEPTFGLNAMWITHSQKNEAERLGYTVVDPLTVLMTHLTEVIQDNAAELLNFSETQKMIEEMERSHQKLIKDLIPGQISLAGVLRVLQRLLAERVSIRDMGTILEAIAEIANSTKNTQAIAEHVRIRLARQLCATYADAEGTLPLVTFAPEWENIFQQSLVNEGEHQYMSLQPSHLHELSQKIIDVFTQQTAAGQNPVLLVSSSIRPHLRNIIERFRSSIAILSHNEIHHKSRIKTVATIQ